MAEKIQQYIQSRIEGITKEFNQLADLASGKISFKDYLKNYADAYKNMLMQSETVQSIVEQSKEAKEAMKSEWEKSKQDFWKNLEKRDPSLFENIRKSYAEHLKENEMHHKYDMSSAAKVQLNGKTGYMGVKEKGSFWQSLKKFMKGEKTVYEAVRNNVSSVRKADALVRGILDGNKMDTQEKMDELRKKIEKMRGVTGSNKPEQMQTHNNVYEAVKAYCTINAMAINGISGVSIGGMDINQCTDIIRNAAPKDLQSAISSFQADIMKPSNMDKNMSDRMMEGIDNLQHRYSPERGQPNKYANLDDDQFRASLGAAYENLSRIEHFNTPENLKKEVLDEIKLVMDEAKRRYPNVGEMPAQGSYFKDADVAKMEQQMMPFMREAAKQDKVFAGDVNRFEAWRDGKDATIAKGSINVTEMPFENTARFGPVDKDFTPEKCHFHNPLESGQRVMSQKLMQEQIALVSQLKSR